MSVTVEASIGCKVLNYSNSSSAPASDYWGGFATEFTSIVMHNWCTMKTLLENLKNTALIEKNIRITLYMHVYGKELVAKRKST